MNLTMPHLRRSEAMEEWKKQALELQMQYYETLGSRNFDEIKKTDLFLLKKKVGFATCGKPTELPNSSNYNTGYKKDDLNQIKLICRNIIENSDCDPIKFACTVLILHYKGFFCESPIFRIVTGSGNIFIDPNARVYRNWEQFMNNNKLPACEYCYPLNGEYDNSNVINIAFAKSPSCSLMSKTTDCLDTVGSIASLGAGSVFLVGSFCTVAPLVATVAGGTALCTGAYSVVRGGTTLYDRSQHGQSIGVRDREARSAWLSVGSSALGAATVCALGFAKNAYESGKSLSKLATLSLHTLTATSVAFSGFGFVETLLDCSEKYKKGVLTKKDVFDLSCELMFLFNAIAAAKATTNFVNSMAAVAETPAAQKKLTKTQKRNIRKRAAKKRARGIVPVVTEEVQSIKVSSAIQLLIFEAVKAYVPRIEEIRYICQSIGHDIQSWRSKEISEVVLISNLLCLFKELYSKYCDEVTQALMKVFNYFSSTSNRFKESMFILLQRSSKEAKNVFCTKIINIEDQLDVIITDAESEIAQLYEALDIQNVESDEEMTNTTTEDYERCVADELDEEARNFLLTCEKVITQSSWSINDIEEFSDILECVKYIVVDDFKTKISHYLVSLDAAKSASSGSFDISTFHKKLKIIGDVEQHIFNETLRDMTVASVIFRIKNKFKEVKKERNIKSTPVWESLTDGMFHYYGPHGTGNLLKSELLSIISSIVGRFLTTDNTSWIEDKDMVLVQMMDDSDTVIIVYMGLTEEKTASGVVMLVK